MLHLTQMCSRVHEAVLSAGEPESGITIHYINEHYDEGGIILQARCPVMPDDTPDTLATRVHQFYGVPEGFNIAIRDVVINRGSEFIVLIAGEILRMPGLPKVPQAEKIDIVNGEIEGLS